ncbi:AAA family ATPase [Pseudonocardia nematodicida]|uniref:AAA family ATPase n=1 Tax=Pseudonocardia nematodicida TaxID=1206997 RepID=A0ABV1K6Q3_9PSEU
MAVVERAAEFRALHSAYDDVLAGRGRLVLVSGPRSSGRTTVVRRFAEQVEEKGALVLTATGSRMEQDVSGGLLCQLVTGATLPPGIAGVVDDLVLTDRSDPHGPERLPEIRRLCVGLVELAARRPIVLVVDDLELADDFSTRALLYLQRRADAVPIMIVLAVTDPSPPAQDLLRTEVSRQVGFARIRLSPLTLGGVRELVATDLGDAYAREQAPSYHQTTGGNPRLVRALVADHLHSPGEGVTTGEAFHDAVLSCLHRGDPTLPAVARAVALLGEEATCERVIRLLDERPTVVQRALVALGQAGLLVDLRFRHPDARDAVLEQAPHDELAEGRQASAMLLYRDGIPVSRVAELLVEAGEPCPEDAVHLLREAAVQLVSQGERHRAAEALDLALSALAPGDPERAAVLAELATVRFSTSPACVLPLLPELEAVADRLRPGDLLTLLWCQLWHGRESAAARTRRLLDEQELADARRADRRALRGWIRVVHPDLPGSEAVTSDVAIGRLAAAGAAGRSAQGAVPDMVPGLAAERPLRAALLTPTPPELLAMSLVSLVRLGRLNRAEHWCAVLIAHAREAGAQRTLAVLHTVKAEIAVHRGHLVEAGEIATRALEEMPEQHWGVALATPLSVAVGSAAALGRVDTAESLLEIPVPRETRRTSHWLGYLRARGQARLAAGRPAAAEADFNACGELAARWDLDLPAWLPWRGDLARTQLELGRHDVAVDLIAAQQARPTGEAPMVRAVALRVLAGAREPGARPELLRESAGLAHRVGARFDEMLALAALSSAHHDLGDPERSRSTARRAMDAARECRAERACLARLPAGAVEDRAGAAPVPADAIDIAPLSSPDALSDAEQRVALLAAQGKSNREISRALYITVSTVEQHLTRVYRKLEVRGRVGLREVIAMEPGHGPAALVAEV